MTFLNEAGTYSHLDTITYSYPLTLVGSSYTKRIPFQRLVLWNEETIFSHVQWNEHGGYGSRLAFAKLNSKHNSERILKENILCHVYQKLKCQEVAG